MLWMYIYSVFFLFCKKNILSEGINKKYQKMHHKAFKTLPDKVKIDKWSWSLLQRAFVRSDVTPTHPKVQRNLVATAWLDPVCFWNKELGYDYFYTLTVKLGIEIVQRHNGTYGFGNAKAFVVNGLIPNTQYAFEVAHSCTSEPTLLSSGTSTTISTFSNGKDFYCPYGLTVYWVVPNSFFILLGSTYDIHSK